MADTMTMTTDTDTDTRIADLIAEIDRFTAVNTKRNLVPTSEVVNFCLDLRNILHTPERDETQ